MKRPALLVALAFCAALGFGCREPLDFDRSFTADPERGFRLYKGNCANTCHPANAFEVKTVKNYEQLAYAVRDYYEQVVGGESNYAQQDVFDMTRYLNDKHYKFRQR